VRRRLLQWIVPAVALTLWQVISSTGLANPLFFPPPTQIAAAAWRLAVAGILERNLAATVARSLAAFLLGGTLGVAFGLLLSLSSDLRDAFKPLLAAGMATPKITLLPLFMLMLGLGESARLMPAAATCFVVCAVHALDAAASVDRRYLDLAGNYGAGKWQQVRHVFLPASLPRLFTGLRVALATSLVITVSAEMLSAESGIGGMIWMGWQTLSVDTLLVGVLAAALLGLCLQFVLEKLERALIPWSKIGVAAALLLGLLVLPVGLRAQTTGMLEGTVVDAAGSVAPDTQLNLREMATGMGRSATADHEGHFTFSGMAPGEYQLEASRAGFSTNVQRGILLTAGNTSHAIVRLQVGDSHDTVAVSADAALVSTSPADWGGTILDRKLEKLPLNGRDMFDLAAQQPGAFITTQSYPDLTEGSGLHLSVNSLRPSQNGYRVDGIYVDDATGSAPASAGGKFLGVEGMQELRLITSPFSAEYGRAASSILTAVSKSGSNQWHGSAYEYLRNSALDARNFFDPQTQPIPPFRRNQFGGLFSGPVKKNRLFFLLNYEAIREFAAQTTVSTTLSDAGRQGILGSQQVTVASAVKPFLAEFPEANGQQFNDGTAIFVGTNRSPTSENYAAGKMDAAISQRWKLASRFTWDNGSKAAQDAMQTVALNDTSQYDFVHNELQFVESPSVVHTFRAGFTRILNSQTAAQLPGTPAGLNFVPGQTMGALQVTGLTETGGVSYLGRPRFYADNDFQLGHQMTYLHGRHTIIAGGSFDRIQTNVRADQQGQGLYRFNSVALFLQGKAASFNFMTPDSDTVRGWRNMLFTGFVQDTWRISTRLQAMVGVRYEAITVPTEVNGKVATIPNPLTDRTVTVGGPLFRNPSKLDFKPRAAIAWDLDGKGTTVLRVGAGLFDDLITSRDLIVSGVRMPPFYLRPLISNPVFPNAVASVTSGTQSLSLSTLTYSPQQPYVAQYQAAVEHQIDAHTVAGVTYAGSRGIHLMGYVGNVDTPTPSFTAAGTPHYVAGSPLLNPAFASIALHTTQFDSYANSLQVHVERRMARGVSIEGSYAFAKSIDDDSSPIFQDFVSSDLVPVFHWRDNRGRSDFDVRHNAAINGTWELPVSHRNAVARFVTAWELDGLMHTQTGFAFNPQTGFDQTGIGLSSGGGGQRPNYIAAPGAKAILGNVSQWFNPAAFGLPAAGYYGNLGRNSFTGPGAFSLDLSAHKTLWAREGQRVTLGVEAFNATNHVNLQVPSGLAVFNSSGARLSSAGAITATATNSRQMQMVLRMTF
jgi:ABC-type nitrate/sulfonate/bicarbonate transport system permease component